MKGRIVSYREGLLEDLKDLDEAVGYLNAAIEDGDKNGFLIALRDVIDAQGSMSGIARRAKLHRVSLHKMLSKGGNPTAESLIALFQVLGIELKAKHPQRFRRPLKKAA